MKLKDYINFLKENSSIKDILLIILSVISIIILISGTVFAVEEELSWSSSNQAITDSQLKNAVSNSVTDVTNEDFTTYSYSSQYYSYNYLLNNYLSNDTYSKAFISSGEDGFYLLISYNKFQLNYRNAGYPYNEHYYGFNSTNMYYFDINNKTISSVNFGGNYTPLNNLGWDFAKTDITINEFETTAYKKNMIYETFFLVLGPIYDNVDNSMVLNSTRSYKVDGNMYEGLEYTGEIVFSEEFETWQTRNLSETFTSGEYYYFIDAFYYDENGVSASNVGTTQRIGEGTVTFNGDSVYLPSVVEVNKAIKQFDGYMNYAYNIVLTRVGSDNELFLSSDLFIVDAKPIVMIPYFRYKYNYIYYGNYIDIGESGDNGSGDFGGGVISPSGDDTNLEGGISGIWQAIVDLPKNLLEGLVGLFVPPSDYFFNDDPDNLGLWQRFSTFFQEKLGFLYDVLAFIPNLISIFVDIIQSFSEDWSIQIPDLTIPQLTGVEEFTFFEGFEWSPYDWVNSREEFRNLYDLYLRIIDFFVYWGLIWYGIKTYNNVMGNVNYDVEGE